VTEAPEHRDLVGAYLVGSPRLLDVRCRSVEQMGLVNALCRVVEDAESQVSN
jgi:hypothetical protein